MEATTARFLTFIRDHHLCTRDDRVLVAVSGGSDSMTLVDLFLEAGFRIGVAHCNFTLRDADSDADEAFVRTFCQGKGLPFSTVRFDTRAFAHSRGMSVEEAARVLRYEWFEEIRRTEGYVFVATAHHADDNIETLLFNFFRGTGIHGLHGIPVKQGRIIRPMLFLSKKEVSAYVDRKQIAFVQDATNLSEAFTRNLLRLRVIPLLGEAFPALRKRLLGNIARFSEAEQLYGQAVGFHRKKLVEIRGEEAFIPILKLKKTVPLLTVTYEIFREWGFSFEQCRQITALLESGPGREMRSESHRLIRDRKWLIVSPVQAGEVTGLLLEKGRSPVEVADLTLSLKTLAAPPARLPGDSDIALLDARHIRYPLLLRRWRQGDYFYPLGLGKKKKLSRFFIDRKIPLHEKEKIWVLESDKRILWVVGMRIDDRFKVGPSTAEVLQVTIKRTHRR